MPRSGRGGQRQLAPGNVSATRTDLNARQPVRVAPGGTYGSGVASSDAQHVVPLPQSDLLPSPAAGAPPPPPAAPAPVTQQTPPPLLAPTSRPGEPVTTGIASGPGAGPEVLGLPTDTLSQRLRQIALTSNSPSLQVLADRAQALGQ